ncbi:MAG: hypothetical protein MI742_08875, partial [Desulfobacterales bacterium]|nr:hypothetical protein [Desulfobacterales bacterium]
GLILSLLRGIHLSHASICGGSWHRPMGALLSGKTVGVVGYGKIGSHLAHLLKPFGCEIFAFDTSPLCHFPASVRQAAFSELLFESDIVTLHLPYNRKTHHLVNESALRRMKKGAYFVNAARGGLVDEAALYQVLRSGKLAGAALDTFGEEPYCGPLSSLDNVLLTAHIGSYAFESRVRMETESVNNLVRVLAEGRRDCGKVEGA